MEAANAFTPATFGPFALSKTDFTLVLETVATLAPQPTLARFLSSRSTRPPERSLQNSTLMKSKSIPTMSLMVACTFLVLLLHIVGETGLGRGAGFPTAALTLANLTVVDYATRAELDLGSSVLTTVSILLAYPALHRRGAVGVACWLACYGAATLAAMWKGPHSLMFLWAPLVAYGWRRRHWSWLRHPGQLVGLLLSLGVLVGWTVALSDHAGVPTVAKTAAIELVSRLIPLSVGDLLSVVYVVPIMFVVILPASLFVVAGFRAGVVYEADDRPADRSPRAVARFCVNRFGRWWSAGTGVLRNTTGVTAIADHVANDSA